MRILLNLISALFSVSILGLSIWQLISLLQMDTEPPASFYLMFIGIGLYGLICLIVLAISWKHPLSGPKTRLWLGCFASFLPLLVCILSFDHGGLQQLEAPTVILNGLVALAFYRAVQANRQAHFSQNLPKRTPETKQSP